jgi:hypothetical protein
VLFVADPPAAPVGAVEVAPAGLEVVVCEPSLPVAVAAVDTEPVKSSKISVKLDSKEGGRKVKGESKYRFGLA